MPCLMGISTKLLSSATEPVLNEQFFAMQIMQSLVLQLIHVLFMYSLF